ncbi:MAG: PucR family transcriptional regulator [Leucobacter sp.]
MNQKELDDVVSLVSDWTGRNVSLDDLAGRVLAYRTVVNTADQARILAVLLKEVPLDARSWEIRHGLNTRTRAFLVPSNPETGSLPRICIPLLVRGVRVGYLWVQANAPDDDMVALLADLDRWRTALEHLAERVLVALGTSAEFVSELDRAFRHLIVSGVEDVPDALEARFRHMPETRIVVFSCDGLGTRPGLLPSLAYMQAIHDAARTVGLSPVSFTDEQHGVCLVPNDSQIEELVEQLAEALRLRIMEEETLGFWHGISRPIQSLGEARTAYRQALVALQATAVDPALPLHSYESTGIYQVLAHVASPRLPVRLELLRASAGGAEKLRFLEQVYDSPGPMQRIAERLHMHRTSVYNHLQRIESIVGADPLDPLVRLELHAGLKLLRWLDRPRFDAPA